jgi:3-oxoacyl-ACP reductase-like protein
MASSPKLQLASYHTAHAAAAAAAAAAASAAAADELAWSATLNRKQLVATEKWL